jgi:hypothetical protein
VVKLKLLDFSLFFPLYPYFYIQEVQRPYRSPEYHATRNALIYAVGSFMLDMIICQTVNCLIADSSQCTRKFLYINIHIYGSKVKDFRKVKFLAVLVIPPKKSKHLRCILYSTALFIFYVRSHCLYFTIYLYNIALAL